MDDIQESHGTLTRDGQTIEVNELMDRSKGRIMKHKIFTFAVMAFIAGTWLTACTKTSEQQVEGAKQGVGEAKQDLKDAQAKYLAEWQTFKRESDSTIAANEKRIDAFKEKMEKAGPKAKAKYNKEVADLERKNHDLKRKLDEYKDEGQGKWEKFKTNFKHDMDAVERTMKDLFKDKD